MFSLLCAKKDLTSLPNLPALANGTAESTSPYCSSTDVVWFVCLNWVELVLARFQRMTNSFLDNRVMQQVRWDDNFELETTWLEDTQMN